MKTDNKPKGALISFIVLQTLLVFIFLSTFPSQVSSAVQETGSLAVASWLVCSSLLLYSILGLISVVQLVLRRPGFIGFFHMGALLGMLGTLAAFLIRQIAYSDRYYYSNDGAWMLFLLILFWVTGWTLYFARSSRVFSYMGSDEYLRRNPLLKNVQTPDPWQDPLAPLASFGSFVPAQPPVTHPAPSMQNHPPHNAQPAPPVPPARPGFAGAPMQQQAPPQPAPFVPVVQPVAPQPAGQPMAPQAAPQAPVAEQAPPAL